MEGQLKFLHGTCNVSIALVFREGLGRIWIQNVTVLYGGS